MASNNNNNVKMSPIKDESVFAERYIPAEFRHINHVPITTPFTACSLPTLRPENLASKLVPPIPECRCEIPHSSDDAPVRKIAPELRYALVPPAIQNASESQPPLPWPTVCNIADLEGYCKTFEKLLWEERAQMLHIYQSYSQYNLPVMLPPTHILSPGAKLESSLTAVSNIPGIADVRPSLQTGDIVLYRPMRYLSLPVKMRKKMVWSDVHHSVEITAQVISVQRASLKTSDQVVTTWIDRQLHPTLQTTYPLSTYNLRFIPNTKLYERCLSALDWLKILPPKLAMNMLFPNEAPQLLTTTQKDDETRHDYGDLNKEQCMFVDMLLLRTRHPSTDTVRPPLLLTGPAGTGKTKTMLKCILQVLQTHNSSARILVCTPSHTAANVVTARLGKHLDSKSLFRLFDSNRPVNTVPVYLLQYCRQLNATGAFCLPSVKELFAFQVIVCTCSDAHLLYRAGLTNAQLRIRRNCFQTFVTSSIQDCNMRGGVIEGVNEPHFTHLFVDEAAQATEPETLIPLSVVVDPLPDNPKVEIVLVGDPRQLSPNVYNTKAADCGLKTSFLERLLQRPISALGGGHPHMLGPPTLGNLRTMQDWIQYSFQKEGQDYLSVFLTLNYRGHLSFLMMPSTLFYFDKLQGAKKTNGHSRNTWIQELRAIEELSAPVQMQEVALPPMFQPIKQSSWPVHFRGVVGQDESVALHSFAGATHSWSNAKEAYVVADIVKTLRKQGVSTLSIGVMAPFRAQVVLIRKLLRLFDLGGVNVGTIEDYQAVERDVIVLSLTRSNAAFVPNDVEHRMGVFQQPKRTNVATTRAENLFIVVGNPVVMVKDPIWRQWLWFFLRNGLWYGENGGKDIVDWFDPTRKPFRCVSHRFGIDSAQFMYSTGKPNEEKDEDDIVTISTLEKRYAPRPLYGVVGESEIIKN
jgi:hypothetical protein